MNRHALVVGIANYDQLNRLPLAASDAQAIARALEDQGDPFKITRLPERIAGDRLTIDSNRRVTRTELERAIVALFLPQGGAAPDTALLFIAGHGLQAGIGFREGYIAASDTAPDGTNGLRLSWLREILARSARHPEGPVKNQVVWLDTCHSGQLLDFRDLDPRTPNRCLIAAARAFEPAYEAIGQPHGVLTQALLAALDPSGTPEGLVTSHTLIGRIDPALRRETQHPLVECSGEPIALVRARATPVPAAPQPGADAAASLRNPYKGLRYFDRDGEDPHDFFGRTHLVDRLVERLRGPASLLAVVGVSGSGKSSAVRAGLLHRLRQGEQIGGSADWPQVLMVPGSNPVASLAYALAEQAGADCDPIRELTRELKDTASPEVLERIVRQLTGDGAPAGPGPSAGRRLILLVDQFEELFTQPDSGARDAFLACLLPALDLCAAGGRPRLTAVLTLRADFYGKCAEQDFRGLARRIESNLVTVLPMDAAELREAIVAPARRSGGEVDESLVTRLVAEVSDEPGHLPLLQDTLTELWQQAVRALPNASAGAPGPRTVRLTPDLPGAREGLSGTLNRRADRFYDLELTLEERDAARWIFIALTRLGEGTEDTRRRVPLAELANRRFDGALIARTVSKLAAERARLLVTGALQARGPAGSPARPARSPSEPRSQQSATEPSSPGTVATLEVAHESLIRHWTRLRAWLEEARTFETWRRRLESEAQLWRTRRREPMTGAELAVALELRGESEDLLGDEARAFLDASVAARDAAEAAERERLEGERLRELQRAEERRLAERERQRTRLVWAWTSIAILVVGLAVTGVLGWSSVSQLFDSRLTHASLLAQPELQDYAEAQRLLAETRALDPVIPQSRRHGRNLLAGFVDMMLARAEAVYRGPEAAALLDLDLSPDGRWLIAASDRGKLLVFDVESGELVRRLDGHDPGMVSDRAVAAVRFDSQSGILYTAGDDRRILRRSPPDWQPVGKAWKAPAAVWALALSPDGKTLASAGIGEGITLWSTGTESPEGETIRTLEDPGRSVAQVESLAFSPDGQRLLSGEDGGEVTLWDLEPGQGRTLPRQHATQVKSVAFGTRGGAGVDNGDGTGADWIATGDGDGIILVWDAQTGEPRVALAGHGNAALDLEPDPGGGRLWSASWDGTLRLWDLRTGATLRVYRGHESGILSVRLRGDRLYTASEDGTVRRWSAGTPGQWVWDLDGEPSAAAVSPDGSMVLVGFADGALRGYGLPIAEGSGGSQAAPVIDSPDAHRDRIYRIAFAADGRTIATGSLDKTARLWKLDPSAVAGQQVPRPLRIIDSHSDAVQAVAFSPDGRILATGSSDGQVGLFDVGTGEGRTFEAHEGGGWGVSVAFAPDGRALLTAGIEDKRLRLWDITRKPPRPQEIAQAKESPLWATLSPDGAQAAAVGHEQVVRLHDLTRPADRPETVQPPVPAGLVGHERMVFRAIYTPDGAQLATVSADMTVRLWDLRTEKPLFTLRLPAERQPEKYSPLWDFDLRCITAQDRPAIGAPARALADTPTEQAGQVPGAAAPRTRSDAGHCWIAVPLTMGRLVLYRLPYAEPPPDL